MHDVAIKGPSQRCLKVGEEIRRVLAAIFQNYFFQESALQSMSITVTEVQMSPDLKHAKIFFLPLGGGNKDAVLAGLQLKAPKIRHLVGKKIYLKNTPALDFRLDESFDSYATISNKLQDVL